MNNLLLEIGSEEIPAGYIEPALAAMASMISEKLKASRIKHGKITTCGTPKRLALIVEDIDEYQEALTTEVTGPPEKVGFDENKKPLTPAVKFAEKLGIPVEEVTIKETKKGRYLCGLKVESADKSKIILASILPELIEKTPFPKTMRWADLSVSFARPIKSILAILNETVISFQYGDVESSNYTYGHRFMQPGKIVISDPLKYAEQLNEASVIVDIEERKRLVKEEIEKTAKKVGGEILPDDELIGIVANLIEFPVVVVGTFDQTFLEVPDEVLITAMREHQKYFSVVDGNGHLMPNFVVVNNTRTKDMNVVTKGHEKVLRARLADAQFFYKADLRESAESRINKLDGVLFQASLGTMRDKTDRIAKLSAYIADVAEKDSVKNDVIRAAELCKSDLVSQVVVEFTKLQGVMGRVYAKISGESEETYKAIEEHYRPVASGGRLPESSTGAILSIADKIDSICGCFSAGLIPTGASDPYALRRQSIGIIQIMLDNKMKFSLKSLISKGVELYADKVDGDVDKVVGTISEFIEKRIERILVEAGFSKDVTASVTGASIDNIPDVWNRVKALEGMKKNPDFEPLAAAFKRVVNIIKKANMSSAASIDKALFESESESGLFDAVTSVGSKVETCLKTSDFDGALKDIATLKAPVDKFFDNVMVMAEDEKVRNNRLALLSKISDLFADIADFSKISA